MFIKSLQNRSVKGFIQKNSSRFTFFIIIHLIVILDNMCCFILPNQFLDILTDTEVFEYYTFFENPEPTRKNTFYFVNIYVI